MLKPLLTTFCLSLLLSSGDCGYGGREDGLVEPEPTPRDMLRLSAATGDREAVETLLAGGLDVNAPDTEGDTVLHDLYLFCYKPLRGRETEEQRAERFSCNARARRLLPYLLGRGADPDARNASGTTPLMRAAEVGDEEGALILIKAGADVRARDSRGATAADRAGGYDEPGMALALNELAGVHQTAPAPTPAPTPSKLRDLILGEWERGKASK